MDSNTLLIIIFLGAILVFSLAVVVVIFGNRQRPSDPVLAQASQSTSTEIVQLRLKAYERLVIMLERMTPSKLVMRMNEGAPNGSQLQLRLMKAVRDEFEHNISMQIYVSNECWGRVCAARDEILQLIQVATLQAGPKGSALELSKQIFAMEEKSGNKGIQHALSRLRDEAHSIMV
jgi:hypothetical protein